MASPAHGSDTILLLRLNVRSNQEIRFLWVFFYLQFQLIYKSRKDSGSLCGFHCCSFLFSLVFPLGLVTVVISMHIKLLFAWWDCRHTKTHYLHSLSELF